MFLCVSVWQHAMPCFVSFYSKQYDNMTVYILYMFHVSYCQHWSISHIFVLHFVLTFLCNIFFSYFCVTLCWRRNPISSQTSLKQPQVQRVSGEVESLEKIGEIHHWSTHICVVKYSVKWTSEVDIWSWTATENQYNSVQLSCSFHRHQFDTKILRQCWVYVH